MLNDHFHRRASFPVSANTQTGHLSLHRQKCNFLAQISAKPPIGKFPQPLNSESSYSYAHKYSYTM